MYQSKMISQILVYFFQFFSRYIYNLYNYSTDENKHDVLYTYYIIIRIRVLAYLFK